MALTVAAQTYDYSADYNQARKFSGGKLANMLFSTQIDPHWTPKGDQFWYTYKTSTGTHWYLVNPAAKTKKPLFDRAWMAAQLSLITHDPTVAEQLPISGLEAKEDGTFDFFVITKNDIKPDTLSDYKPTKGQETFFFSYNPVTQKLTRLEDKWRQQQYPRWASISPDGKTVVFAKDSIRTDVDKTNKKGQYILTGSARPADDKIMHSGTGRIARLTMRTMSLYESLESNGVVSFSDI